MEVVVVVVSVSEVDIRIRCSSLVNDTSPCRLVCGQSGS
jgi:hypothetical protein